jgi:hypothetical protein
VDGNRGGSYLGRVKKDQIIEAIGKGPVKRILRNFGSLKIKKAELVATAEQRLAQSRWLPEILRA